MSELVVLTVTVIDMCHTNSTYIAMIKTLRYGICQIWKNVVLYTLNTLNMVIGTDIL